MSRRNLFAPLLAALRRSNEQLEHARRRNARRDGIECIENAKGRCVNRQHHHQENR